MKLDKVIDGSIVLGVGLGLTDVQNILCIILLSCQVFLIMVKAITKIYLKVKNGKLEEIEEVINDAKEELKDFDNKL